MATVEHDHSVSEATAPKMETVISFDPTQVEVTVTPVPHYTESQLKNQRLFVREMKHESKPGERLARLGVNAAIFTGATLADLGESHLIDKVMRHPLEKNVEKTKEKIEAGYTLSDHIKQAQAVSDGQEKEYALEVLKEQHRKVLDSKMGPARTAQGVAWAADFVEEWATDSLYSGLANTWVRNMTGMNDAKYVSETSAFVSEWGNFVTQVFFGNRLFGKTEMHGNKVEPKKWHGVKLAYMSMDILNPVNLEAAIRIVEEVPVLGDGVSWLHDKTDHLLESAKTRVLNSAVGKAVTGFHIGKNIKPL